MSEDLSELVAPDEWGQLSGPNSVVLLTASAGRLFMAHVRAKEMKNSCALHMVDARHV